MIDPRIHLGSGFLWEYICFFLREIWTGELYRLFFGHLYESSQVPDLRLRYVFRFSDLSFIKIDLSFAEIFTWVSGNGSKTDQKSAFSPKNLRSRSPFFIFGTWVLEKYLSFPKNLSFFLTWVFRKVYKKNLTYSYWKNFLVYSIEKLGLIQADLPISRVKKILKLDSHYITLRINLVC